MRMPEVLVIGAMKCGTTSLFHYLSRHPEIDMARVKELNFFVEEGNWHKGRKWYGGFFKGEGGVRVEVSPWYTMYPFYKGVPQRISQTIEKPRFIYLMGDPIKRLVSDYLQLRGLGIVHQPIEKVLEHPPYAHLIDRSRYWLQLQQYLKYYALDDFLLVRQEDLAQHRTQTLARIFQFLGVDPDFQHPDWNQLHNQSSRKRALTPAGQKLQPLLEAPLSLLPSHYRIRPRNWLQFPFSRPLDRPELSRELMDFCREKLTPDLKILNRETGFSISSWGF